MKHTRVFVKPHTEPFEECIKHRGGASRRFFLNVCDYFVNRTDDATSDGFLELIADDEWTEAYVFLRLLGDGRIYGATVDLKKDQSTYIDILNVIREEKDKLTIFERFVESQAAKVRVVLNDEVFIVVTAPELTERARELYDSLRSLKSATRTVSIPETQTYLETLGIDTPKPVFTDKVKKKYGVKTDIVFTSIDALDRMRTTSGFSIKSHIGQSATLFNCSQSSGFSYEIEGCDEAGMHEMNALDGMAAIMDSIGTKYKLLYVGCRDAKFKRNINLLDSQMHEIMQTLALLHAKGYGKNESRDMKDLCQKLVEADPIHHEDPQYFYPAKLKDFLYAAFAGLTASEPWDGRKNISGGYIDVDKDGEMLYYRAISQDIFERYLFEHTYVDGPSRGLRKDIAHATAKAWLEGRTPTDDELREATFSKTSGKRKGMKGNYGFVYEKGGKYYIDINFQIRFR